jgi:hypothetical protein
MCGCKTLLWGSSGWEIEVTFQTIGTYGQGDEPSLEGSYLCLHKTLSIFLVPSFLNTFKARNAHQEAIDVSFYTGHEWTEGTLVETLELIWCVEGSNKIPKTWIFEWNFW